LESFLDLVGTLVKGFQLEVSLSFSRRVPFSFRVRGDFQWRDSLKFRNPPRNRRGIVGLNVIIAEVVGRHGVDH
jgi:hypothetical protein